MNDERELTEEGLRMWNNLSNYQKLAVGITLMPEPKKRKARTHPTEIELGFLRLEIKKMIKNSQMVVEDCNKLITACSNMEEYLSCDAKVAKMIHTNLIDRLTRVLNGGEAFDHEVKLDPEEEEEVPNKLFVDTFKNAFKPDE